MDRQFISPIRATLHLTKLAELAASNPSAVRCFTLGHVALATCIRCGRKDFPVISAQPLQHHTMGVE